VEHANAGFCIGGRLLRRIIRDSGNFVRVLQVREYLLATLAIRDMRFQGRHLLRAERMLVICSERFCIAACTALIARGSVRVQMTRERIFKASFAVVRRHSPLLL
jgi:hypothetical protein